MESTISILRRDGAILIPQGEIYQFYNKRFINTMSPFQRALGVFNFMQLTSKGKYRRFQVSTDGSTWQPHVACGSAPTGSAIFSSQEIEPCAVDRSIELCGEMYNTCFEQIDSYDPDGGVTTDVFESNMFDGILSQFSVNAANDLWTLLLMGDFWETQDVVISSKIPNGQRAAILSQDTSCQGLVSWLHENVVQCDAFDDTDLTTCTSGNEIVAFLDRLLCCAREKSTYLQTIVDLGMTGGQGEAPVIILSGNLYGKVRAAYRSLVNVSSPEFSALAKMTIPGPDGSQIDMFTYEGVGIVPVSAFNSWDSHYQDATTGNPVKFMFAALTTTGNIGFGNNFADLMEGGNMPQPVGLKINKYPEAIKENTWKVKSTALTMVDVFDQDRIVWDSAVVVG